MKHAIFYGAIALLLAVSPAWGGDCDSPCGTKVLRKRYPPVVDRPSCPPEQHRYAERHYADSNGLSYVYASGRTAYQPGGRGLEYFDDRNLGRFSNSFTTAQSFRQQLLFQAEQQNLASRFDPRFLDGIQKDDEAFLLRKLAEASFYRQHGRYPRSQY